MVLAVDDNKIMDSFLYQFALANGVFTTISMANSTTDPLPWKHEYEWKGRQDSHAPKKDSPITHSLADHISIIEPAVIFPRWQDEHGNPTALALDIEPQTTPNEHDIYHKVKLTLRKGRTSSIKTGESDDKIEMLNTTLTFKPAVNSSSLFHGHLRSIDPLSYSARCKKLQTVELADIPYWVKNGSVWLSSAPREMHGLAQGTLFEYVPPTGQGKKILCGLVVSAWEPEEGGGPIHDGILYAQTDLEFDNAEYWNIVSQLEEREVAKKDALEVYKVGRRKAKGKAGLADKTFRVPALDTNVAFTNTVGQGRKNMTIRKNAEVWLSTTNTSLLEDKFKMEPLDKQQHRNGARIGAPDSQKFFQVIEIPPSVSETLENTGRRGVDLIVPDAGALLPHPVGAAVVSAQEFSTETKSDFFFGLSSSVNDITVLNRTDPVMSDPFRIAYEKFSAIWNGGELQIRKRPDFPDPDSIIEVYHQLRKDFSSPIPKANDPVFDDNVFFQQAADKLRDLTRQGRQSQIHGLDDILGKLGKRLEAVTAKQIKQWWTGYTALHPSPVSDLNILETEALLNYLWHPAQQSIYRDILQQITVLTPYQIILLGPPDNWDDFVQERVDLIPVLIKQGVDGSFVGVANHWRDIIQSSADSELQALWQRYGGEFTKDVYEELTRLEADAQQLFSAYQLERRLLNESLMESQEVLDQLESVWSDATSEAAQRLRDALGDVVTPEVFIQLALEENLDKLIDLYLAYEEVKGKYWLIRHLLKDTILRGQLIKVWRTSGNEQIKLLHMRYGEQLEDEVLARFAEAYAWMDQIHTKFGGNIKSLADLLNNPPDYLFMTKRFDVEKKNGDDDRLWQHNFDLAKIAGSAGWRMFPDLESSVVVKLGGKRGLMEILKEIHEAYAAPTRPNPLGVLAGAGNKRDGFEPIKALQRQLHPNLLHPSWRGVLIIRPMADLTEDAQLVNLIGFSMITAQYVAISGGNSDISSLDIYGYVFKAAEPRDPSKDDREKKPREDLRLTCTKFEAMIKNTRLESGEIVLTMDVQNLFGTKKDEVPEGEGGEKWRAIIRGTLPPEKKDGSNEPRAFTFGAWFEKPLEFEIDLGFIKSISLRSIRVGRSKGRTALEVDADMNFQDWPDFEALPFNSDLEFEGLVAQLKDFRILLPSIEASGSIDIGMPRLLDFEFPSVNIRLPKPRALNIGGLEIKPYGLGFFRFEPPELSDFPLPNIDTSLLSKMKADYSWLGEAPFDMGNLEFDFPHLNCRVELGDLPMLGAVEAEGLELDLIIGLYRKPEDRSNIKPVIGISRAGADRLSIDLFRLFTLELDKPRFGRYEMQLNDASQVDQVSAFIVENIRLRLLGWEPLKGDDMLQMMMIQGDPAGNRELSTKGMLTYLKTDGADLGFINLYWMLLGHNIELPNDILSSLLEPSPETMSTDNIIKELVTEPDTSNKGKIKAALLDEEDWLFGAGFGVAGEFLKECSFILHDQHYYGIALSSKWLTKLIGQERLLLAYMPGDTPSQDRFKTNFRIPALDFLGALKSGEFGLEWGVNLDFLVDIGYPWQVQGAYDWFRTFSIPAGTYEGKTGYFFEKRTALIPTTGEKTLELSAGMGFYAGYYFGFTTSVIWVNAGIGVFAMLQGTLEFKIPDQDIPDPLRGSIERLEVIGVLGILAYVDGGIEVWVLSARFRVSLQASLTVLVEYIPPTGDAALTYQAGLSADYSASVRVGAGPFKWTFRINGSYNVPISGQVLLN